jgi:hypothetical protein
MDPYAKVPFNLRSSNSENNGDNSLLVNTHLRLREEENRQTEQKQICRGGDGAVHVAHAQDSFGPYTLIHDKSGPVVRAFDRKAALEKGKEEICNSHGGAENERAIDGQYLPSSHHYSTKEQAQGQLEGCHGPDIA